MHCTISSSMAKMVQILTNLFYYINISLNILTNSCLTKLSIYFLVAENYCWNDFLNRLIIEKMI